MDVTVVIPMHDAAATIAECLAAIAAQSVPPARILVVDDASSDGSVGIVRNAGMANVEILELSHNRGPGAARNAGAALAQTEWLAFLDSDDYWEPDFLECVKQALEQTGADFAGAGGLRALDYHNRRKRSMRVLSGRPDTLDLTDDFWRVALRFMPVNSSSAVVRRVLFQRTAGFCETVRNGEDMPLWAELWLTSGRFAFANRLLFRSVAPPSGLSAAAMPYRAVRVPLWRAARCLARSIARRKRGTGWFAAWFAGAVLRRHATWLARRARRLMRDARLGLTSAGP
jgi:glycosyltransferase involved in cell wall biosynthesis